MKSLIFLLFLLTANSFSNDFDLEIMSASDGSNSTIFKFSNNITYRYFLSYQNWKHSLGDWGSLECVGNHTIIKEEGIILKIIAKA